jgi:ABC-2 type transport system permease protein
MSTVVLPALSLWRREVVRFVRQPNRIVGAIGSPLLFWLLIGSGVGRSFQGLGGRDVSYLAYVFPGILVMIVLFTAVFSTISIIEDRREGFLQSVLVAPVSRGVIVLGKVLGGAFLAFLQAMILLALAPTVGIRLTLGSVLGVIAVIWIIGMELTSLGFFIAWRMQSIQGFHAIMNLLLLPMWLLSASVFPASGASSWVGWLIRLNPLTYGVAAIRHLLGGVEPGQAGVPSLPLSLLVTVGGAVLLYLGATWAARGHTSGDLQ